MADQPKSRPVQRDMARCSSCRAWASVPEGEAISSACGGCGGHMVKVDMTEHAKTLPYLPYVPPPTKK
jgi:hypothetical protein